MKFVAEKTVNENGTPDAELRYKPWGESRYTFGATPTKRRFTGQVLDNVAGGLYFYNARYYDPALGRFISADTSVISVLKNLATFRTAGRSASLRSCVEFLI